MSDPAEPPPAPSRRQRLRAVFGLGRPQERRLLAACREDPSVRIVARCSSAPEVLAVLRGHGADVALLDEDLHLLGDDQFAELEAGRFPTVVLTRDPDADRWAGLRVYPVSVEAEVTQILLALDEVVRGTHRTPRQRRAAAPEPPPVGAGKRQDRLQVFTFWGGAGSPGRTTLAINWGTLLGSAARTIVVDLDLTGAALAAHLDDTAGETGRRARVSPNLVQLASTDPQTAEAWTRELERTVAPLGPFSPHGFFLRGVPRPLLREAVSGAFVERLIAELRRRYTYVLLDVGDEPLGDGSREAAVIAAALRAADQVLVVAPPDGPGLHQTYMALLEGRTFLDWERAAVIVNRYDARHHQAELARVEEALGLPLAGVLPLDSRATQRALAAGRPVVCDPRSRLRRPLQRLVEQVHGGQLRMPAETRRGHATAVWGRLRAALGGRKLALGGTP